MLHIELESYKYRGRCIKCCKILVVYDQFVVDFVDDKKYLSGLLGSIRPINVAEIANLSRTYS